MRHAGLGYRDVMRPLNVWDALSGIMDSFGVLLGVLCLLLGIGAAALLLWFIRRIVAQWRRSGDTQRAWPRTRAVIESIGTLAGTGVETVRYRFTVDGVEITGEDDASVVPHATAGVAVDVAYDPADPRENAIASKISQRRWSWVVLSVIVAVLLGLCTYGLLALGIDMLFVDS